MNKNKINISSVTYGADPEILLFSPSENRHVTAIGLITGTKDKPTPITKDGHFIQLDGVAAEYNIPPCKTKEEFIEHNNFVKEYINETIAKPNGYVLSQEATAEFTDEQLAHRCAQEIGCSSSIRVWDMTIYSPSNYKDNKRHVGGHLAIGYANPDEETSFELVKALDLFLGVGSVLLDKNTERRKLYGQAGDMRLKPWGLEFRPLSNFWIWDNNLMGWIIDNANKAIEFVNQGGIITNPEQIVECINTCNKELALEIIDDYNIPMPIELMKGELVDGLD